MFIFFFKADTIKTNLEVLIEICTEKDAKIDLAQKNIDNLTRENEALRLEVKQLHHQLQEKGSASPCKDINAPLPSAEQILVQNIPTAAALPTKIVSTDVQPIGTLSGMPVKSLQEAD